MLKNEAKNLGGREIGTLDASQIEEALDVIARGMGDNPRSTSASTTGSTSRSWASRKGRARPTGSISGGRKGGASEARKKGWLKGGGARVPKGKR